MQSSEGPVSTSSVYWCRTGPQIKLSREPNIDHGAGVGGQRTPVCFWLILKNGWRDPIVWARHVPSEVLGVNEWINENEMREREKERWEGDEADFWPTCCWRFSTRDIYSEEGMDDASKSLCETAKKAENAPVFHITHSWENHLTCTGWQKSFRILCLQCWGSANYLETVLPTHFRGQLMHVQ